MAKIRLLDCTLRDGGYCNEWIFGENAISQVVQGLENSKVDIIECGYLKTSKQRIEGSTLFGDIADFEKPLVNRSISNSMYVCMINYGDCAIDSIPEHYSETVDGIRVAFHKKDMLGAIAYCDKLSAKGYQVYVQPMVTLDYSNDELIALTEAVNKIETEALYIVDSFGAMDSASMHRIFTVIHERLRSDISIGFHGHNNLQLSYANAQVFLNLCNERDAIVDTSIFGMGRGAGNLSTELFEEYLNDRYGKTYEITPILNIYDQVLARFYANNRWGYSLSNYLSARHNSHPNYAQYWDSKNTLSVTDINNLFESIEINKKNTFDREYAEKLYVAYMSKNDARVGNLRDFESKIKNRNLMIIASGKSSESEKEKIIDTILEKNCVVVSINRDYPFYKADYIFVSNLRRFESIDEKEYKKTITTSNVSTKNVYATIEYAKYLNNYEAVEDNALLMLLSFLRERDVKDILLAGVDGFSHDIENNYADSEMIIKTSNDVFDLRNKGINEYILSFKKQRSIVSITKPKYIVI